MGTGGPRENQMIEHLTAEHQTTEHQTTERMTERRRVLALAIDLLDRAVTLLDHENLDTAAAKIDEVRCALRVPAHVMAHHNAGGRSGTH